jgi:hypothetical protein
MMRPLQLAASSQACAGAVLAGVIKRQLLPPDAARGIKFTFVLSSGTDSAAVRNRTGSGGYDG